MICLGTKTGRECQQLVLVTEIKWAGLLCLGTGIGREWCCTDFSYYCPLSHEVLFADGICAVCPRSPEVGLERIPFDIEGDTSITVTPHFALVLVMLIYWFLHRQNNWSTEYSQWYLMIFLRYYSQWYLMIFLRYYSHLHTIYLRYMQFELKFL
jgi:hypothetical protein